MPESSQPSDPSDSERHVVGAPSVSEMTDRVERLERRIARERSARQEAERLLESKSLELYQANVELKAMTQELEARVAERTAEVQRLVEAEREIEEQLRRSQKMEALGLLAGGVAHDFNNLLTVIGGVTQLLHDEPALTPYRDLLGEVLDASKRAGALSGQLLAFSRRRATEAQVFRIGDAVRDLQPLLRRLLTERIQLQLDLDERLHLHMDRDGLDQILLNLAANARDAMPAGGWFAVRTSTVTLSEDVAGPLELAAGEYIRLEAADSGCGMSPEVRQRAFDPFFTTKAIGSGSGLGLSNVYAIVRQSHGHVSIDSVEGRGTTFRLLLPAAQAKIPGKPERPEPVAHPRANVQTILVVDDEPGVRAVAAMVLRKQGYLVLEASSGPHALDVVRSAETPIQLLLSDVRMPGMHGYELARILREENPALKVLLMSGYVDDDGLRQRIDDAGIPLLEKPFRPAALTQEVLTVLAGTRATEHLEVTV